MRNKKIFLIFLAAAVILAVFAVFVGNQVNSDGLLPVICAAALVDCVNPCAFSVLLLTIAFLLSAGAMRMDILKIGLFYVLGIFVAYLGIGLGLLKAIGLFGVSGLIAEIGAIILIAVGFIELLNVFWPKFPVKLKIPGFTHRKIAGLIEKGSMAAAFILGALVGVFEFPCTGGPYLSILGLLHDRVTYSRGVAYLLIYNIIFILPLLVVLFASSKKTLLDAIEKWRKDNSRRMKIIGGLAMVVLGVIIFLI
jgi:cytochrome c biogenesis protein CcdA